MSFISLLVSIVVSLFQSYGPLSVFVGVLIEEIIVPLPSQIILMAAGYSLVPINASIHEAFLTLLYNVVIPGAIAGTIGSFFAYGIGYYGGKRIINKYKKFFGTDWKKVNKMSKKIGKGKKLWIGLILSRAIPIIPVFIVSLAYGAIRADAKKFAFFTLLGQIPRAFILGIGGWYLGGAYIKIADQLGSLEDVVLILIIVLFVFMLLRKRQVQD